MMRIWAVAGVALIWALASAEEVPSAAVAFRIEPQDLGDALNEFAHQSGMQLMVNIKDLPTGRIAPRVEGELSPEVALRQLLAGSGLGYEFLDEHMVAVGQGAQAAAGKTSMSD